MIVVNVHTSCMIKLKFVACENESNLFCIFMSLLINSFDVNPQFV